MSTPSSSTDLSQPKPPRKPRAKLFHNKSRNGCQTCKDRRVKCNEGRPVCSHCQRLGLDCVYENGKHATKWRCGCRQLRNQHNSDQSEDGLLELHESTARRKLEIELFYHYSTQTAPSIAAEKTTKVFWGSHMCLSATKSDAVLYSVLVLAALHRQHQSGRAPSGSDSKVVPTYLDHALREHHKDIAELHHGKVDDACLASSALRIYDFIRLQTRPLEPYTPPVDWLLMTGASRILFLHAAAFVSEEKPQTLGASMMTNVYKIMNEADSMQHLDELHHLLQRQLPHELVEYWDDETQDTYRYTVSYIANIWTVRHERATPGLSRKLVIFPMVVQRQFITFVEERRPRALAILAYYFALLAMMRGHWFIGNAGIREFYAIVAQLPQEWKQVAEPAKEMLENLDLCDLSKNHAQEQQSREVGIF